MASEKLKKEFFVFTDIGSTDIDDFIALMLLKQHAKENSQNFYTIVTCGHYASQRARMTWAFLDIVNCHNIEVVVGYEPTTTQQFQNLYPAFPKLFGRVFFPGEEPIQEGEKQWFPPFGKAFAELAERAPFSFHPADKIVRGILATSSDVVICLLCPPTDFANFAMEFNFPKNTRVYSMGGESANKKAGYNWGICPFATEQMLVHLKEKTIPLFVIDGASCRSLDITFPSDLFTQWLNQSDKSPIQKAFMQERINSINGNVLSNGKLLCDPITMAVALADEAKLLDVGCYTYQFGPHTDNYLQMSLERTLAEDNLSNCNAFVVQRSLLSYKAKLIDQIVAAWNLLQ